VALARVALARVVDKRLDKRADEVISRLSVRWVEDEKVLDPGRNK